MISLLDMNVSELANVMTIWKFATNQLENACQAAYLDGKERTVPSVSNKDLFSCNHFVLLQLLKVSDKNF